MVIRKSLLSWVVIRGGGVLLSGLLLSCSATGPEPFSLEPAWKLLEDEHVPEAAALLDRYLRLLDGRPGDFEATLAKLRIHIRLFDERLRFEALNEADRGPYRSASGHLAQAGRLSVEILTSPASPDARMEAARTASWVFQWKAGHPEFRMTPVTTGDPRIETYLLLRIAACFASHAPSRARDWSAEKLAASLASQEILSDDARILFRSLARPQRSASDDRAFLRLPLPRHVEEGMRALDLGTREYAERGNRKEVLRLYLQALRHLILVRECTTDPLIPEEISFGAIPSIRSAIDRLCRPDSLPGQ